VRRRPCTGFRDSGPTNLTLMMLYSWFSSRRWWRQWWRSALATRSLTLQLRRCKASRLHKALLTWPLHRPFPHQSSPHLAQVTQYRSHLHQSTNNPSLLYLNVLCYLAGNCIGSTRIPKFGLTLSSPVIPNGYTTSRCLGPYWSNPRFFSFFLTFGLSGAQDWAPECPNIEKIKRVG